MEEHLPTLGLDEEQVVATIAGVLDELRAERGPDFYRLPVLFEELGMDQV